MDKKFKFPDSKIYLIIIGLISLVLFFYQPILGFLGLLALGYSIFYSIKSKIKAEDNLKIYTENLSEEFDTATKHAIFNMPFPLVLLDEAGLIIWYNTPFLNLMGIEHMINENIKSILPEIDIDKLNKLEDNKSLDIQLDERYFRVFPNSVDARKLSGANDKIIMLYWVENTDFIRLKEAYDSEELAVTILYVDNYDDVRNSTEEVNRPFVLAEIDNIINSYYAKLNGIIRKYESDKYIIIHDKAAYELMLGDNFEILDEMREVNMGNTIPITLSLGISVGEVNPAKAYNKARGAIEIGLGRGGDQAVVQDGDNLNFYGGKSQAVEKRNRVRARVIAHALSQLIDQADNVIIMGHVNPDMDAIGSAIGVLGAVIDKKKEGYIVLNHINPSIKNIYSRMEEEESIISRVIDTERALDLVKENSLLIMVDNHKPSFTEAPELTELIDKIVVIDHHRRGAEFVEDPVLIYLEPYASSASELVTEILSYMDNEVELTKFEAEALLAGITVDTKNFSFQTGVRTFEAASMLKRAGADSQVVREFFKDDFDTFVEKAEVISSSIVVEGIAAIGKLDKAKDNSILVAAQAADELLQVNGVEASFVLANTGDGKIHISGRSLGRISVQIILERLGGGGHLTSAGTQMEETMERAEELLINAIKEYLQESEKDEDNSIK